MNETIIGMFADHMDAMLVLTCIGAGVDTGPDALWTKGSGNGWQYGRRGMTEMEEHPDSPSSGSHDGGGTSPHSADTDTPLTDALLDQFSAYYVVAVLAVRALEEARRQHALAETG